MKVALEATALLGEKSGVGQFVMGAVSALNSLPGVDLSAFAVTWRRRGQLAQRLPSGVRPCGLPMPARPLNRMWSSFEFPPVELFLGKVDVVHGTNFVVPPAILANRVVTVHDLTPLRFPEFCRAEVLVFPRLVKRAMDRGAIVHTPSEFVRREVIELLGGDPDRVVAVAHGIGEVSEDALSMQLTEPHPRYLLALGTIEPRKDYITLLRAFDRVAESEPDLRLVIAGGRGWGFDEFKAELERTKNRARVDYVGYVDDHRRVELLRGASVFVYPSIYEGFGFPPLEAMACRTPVVTTRAGAIEEVVGDAAILAEVGDPHGLADAIDSVLNDQPIRSRLIGEGQARVKQFTWHRAAEGLLSIYRLFNG